MMGSPDLAGSDKGVLARAVGVIFSPADTFRAVAARPRPAGIMLLVCLITGLATGLPQLTERGRQSALDMQVQQTERFTGQPVTPDAYSRMETFSRYSGYVAMASTFVAIPVITMIIAALCWAVFNTILGGTAAFKQVLGVVAHSQVVTALGALAAAPIQMVQGIQSAAGPFNLGALAPMFEPGTFIANFLGALSFFALWQVVVMGIGLAELYRRRAGRIVTVLLILSLAFTAAITAALFNR